ncbi:MAG: hypothetical protein RL373_26 [Pseudomonadota bacterium]|jgi:hypothetical protein
MNNEPVAYRYEDKSDPLVFYFTTRKDKTENPDAIEIPLYAQPQKYCPSEDNAAYEKGFIDGMAQMTESAVHRAVEGMAVKELSDEDLEAIYQTMTGIEVNYYEYARACIRKAQEK